MTVAKAAIPPSMTESPDFYIKFWGVRGSIACPGASTVRYGGNTTCIEVRCGGQLLIIDGGTGLRELGLALGAGPPEPIDLFFTHTHFDHICGVPFFRPAYMKDRAIRFWAGHLRDCRGLKTVLCDMMIAPLFPVPLHVFTGAEYHDFPCGVPLEPKPGVRLDSCRLVHPNGACGYRITYAGKSICIITDTEHVPGQLDQTIVDFVAGTDLMVYDSMFTDEEFPKYVTWGHSTWQQALRVGEAAGVKRVVLFHHDPQHTDDIMDRIAEQAELMRPGTVVAREGMVLHP